MFPVRLPDSSGGIVLAEILNTLENVNLYNLGHNRYSGIRKFLNGQDGAIQEEMVLVKDIEVKL